MGLFWRAMFSTGDTCTNAYGAAPDVTNYSIRREVALRRSFDNYIVSICFYCNYLTRTKGFIPID